MGNGGVEGMGEMKRDGKGLRVYGGAMEEIEEMKEDGEDGGGRVR